MTPRALRPSRRDRVSTSMRTHGVLGLACTLALGLLAHCATPRAASSDNEILEPGTTWHFRDGGGFTYTVDDRTVLVLSARDGRLFCNDVDMGPYRPGAPVRFLSEREIEIDGVLRPVPPPSPRD